MRRRSRRLPTKRDLQTRLDPRSPGRRKRRSILASVVIVFGERFVSRVCFDGLSRRLGLAGLAAAFDRPADQHEQQVRSEGEHAIHGQVRHGGPDIAADLEHQVKRGDRHGWRHRVLGRVDHGRRKQQHRDRHQQRLLEIPPHPAGHQKPYQQATQRGEGVDAPGDQIVVFGHDVRGKPGKEALMITAFA